MDDAPITLEYHSGRARRQSDTDAWAAVVITLVVSTLILASVLLDTASFEPSFRVGLFGKGALALWVLVFVIATVVTTRATPGRRRQMATVLGTCVLMVVLSATLHVTRAVPRALFALSAPSFDAHLSASRATAPAANVSTTVKSRVGGFHVADVTFDAQGGAWYRTGTEDDGWMLFSTTFVGFYQPPPGTTALPARHPFDPRGQVTFTPVAGRWHHFRASEWSW